MGVALGGMALALAIVLRRSRRPELVGWLGPVAALGAAGAFLAQGEVSRRAAPPTVAALQVVEAVPGTAVARDDRGGLLARNAGELERGKRGGGILAVVRARHRQQRGAGLRCR